MTTNGLRSLLGELQRRNVLRVALAYLAAAWLLVQVLETLLPIFGLPETSIRRVVLLLAAAFVPVLVLAWVFEWTPEGIKREATADTAAAPESGRGRTLDRIIMAVLALALGVFAVDKFVLDPARDQVRERTVARQARGEALVEAYGDKSIAVLPFANLSPDPEQQYFSDGIAEELLNQLTKIPDLRVISQSSAFKFRGDVDVREVAEQLDVVYVLRGSVRRNAERVRITAHLIDARSDTQRWTRSYDRPLDDIFAIQDEIASLVVHELQVELLGSMPTATRTDSDVLAQYLKAKSLVGAWQGEQAEALLKKLLEVAPDYVPAWTLLASAYSRQTGEESSSRYSYAEGDRLAREAIEQALRIDPDDAVANARLGQQLLLANDPVSAAPRIQRAFARDPNNAEVLKYAGQFANAIGRFDLAMDFAQRAVARDPLCDGCVASLIWICISARRFDDCEPAARRRIELLGGKGGWIRLGDVLLLKREPLAALEAIDVTKSSDQSWFVARARALHSLGRRAEFDDMLARLLEVAGPADAIDVASVYAWSGDAKAAFEWLARASSLERKFFFYAWDPFFESLHDDPRWLALRERAGLDPATLEKIAFDVKLP